MKEAVLILDDGTKFHGRSFGYEKAVSGEVVFNTAMTGYPESLTDPSYAGQIMALTYPLVGNYGVPASDYAPDGLPLFMESGKIHVEALIVRDRKSTRLNSSHDLTTVTDTAIGTLQEALASGSARKRWPA